MKTQFLEGFCNIAHLVLIVSNSRTIFLELLGVAHNSVMQVHNIVDLLQKTKNIGLDKVIQRKLSKLINPFKA